MNISKLFLIALIVPSIAAGEDTYKWYEISPRTGQRAIFPQATIVEDRNSIEIYRHRYGNRDPFPSVTIEKERSGITKAESDAIRDRVRTQAESILSPRPNSFHGQLQSGSLFP